MISTGGTIVESIRALLGAGARPEFLVAATHALLLPGARDRLQRAGVLELNVTDTVPANGGGQPPVRVVSVAPLIACAVRRCLAGGSAGEEGMNGDSQSVS
jgi:ribose-phosphate pyrophosphokinase